MVGKGRPRKNGKRERNGRLQRDSYAVNLVKGSEWVQGMTERYGQDYGSALGRAYASGLLGEGNEAKVRYDAGKRFSRLYSALIEQGRYGCPLGRETRSTGSAVAIMAHPRAVEDQDWLFAAMNALDSLGLRPWLDQLILDAYHDRGPYWLDAMLGGGKHPADVEVLKTAIRALDAIAPETPAVRIVAIRT